MLEQSFPAESGVAGRVVFADPDGDITDAKARAAIEATLAEMAAGPHVIAVTDPFDPAQPSGQPGRHASPSRPCATAPTRRTGRVG